LSKDSSNGAAGNGEALSPPVGGLIAPSGFGQRSNNRTLHATSNAITDLQKRVDGLETSLKQPFYKDRSFWIGITAIPIIFASGWLLKITTDRPFLLREIHRLLGTEPALIAALDERNNAFKTAIQSITNDRLPLLTAIFRVGLLQERAQRLNCSPDTTNPLNVKFHCEIPPDAFVSVADAPFSVGSLSKVDVGIIVNVTENLFRDDGYREKGDDKTNEAQQLIRVSLNGKTLTLSDRSRWSPTIDIQGNHLMFAKYKFPDFELEKPEVADFPINTLSVSVSNSINRHYSVVVGVLISENLAHDGQRSDERAADK
jgi:hypothetical protein